MCIKSVHIGALGDAGIKGKNNVSTWIEGCFFCFVLLFRDVMGEETEQLSADRGCSGTSRKDPGQALREQALELCCPVQSPLVTCSCLIF